MIGARPLHVRGKVAEQIARSRGIPASEGGSGWNAESRGDLITRSLKTCRKFEHCILQCALDFSTTQRREASVSRERYGVAPAWLSSGVAGARRPMGPV